MMIPDSGLLLGATLYVRLVYKHNSCKTRK